MVNNRFIGFGQGAIIAAPQNYFIRSEDFPNSAWTATGVTGKVGDQAANPVNGATTADKITESSTTASAHYVFQGVTNITSGVTYTISVYALAVERSAFQIYTFANFGGANAKFDISAGTVTATAGGATASIVSIGGGWYRCIMTATAASTATTNIGFIMLSGGTDNYAGTIGSGLMLFGAQINVGNSAGVYTSTVASQIL